MTVDGGHPILQDIHLDHSKNFIFAASPYKVSNTTTNSFLSLSLCLGWLCFHFTSHPSSLDVLFFPPSLKFQPNEREGGKKGSRTSSLLISFRLRSNTFLTQNSSFSLRCSTLYSLSPLLNSFFSATSNRVRMKKAVREEWFPFVIESGVSE